MDVGLDSGPHPISEGHSLVFNTATVGINYYGTTPGSGGIPAGDVGPIALTAKNSIFTDALNASNANSPTTFPNVPTSTPVQGQYCNGARIPPEQCSTNQGANHPAMCKGYFTPAGQSETVGVSPVFVFNGIAASATVDEGNNWINMTYGPLTLGRPPVGTAGSTPSAEPTVASAAIGIAKGAYSITSTSAAVGAGSSSAPGVPSQDFYGQTRSTNGTSIGAVELVPAVTTPTKATLTSITPSTVGRSALLLLPNRVSVSIIGTNLTNATAVTVSGNGVTCNGIVVVSATQVTATCSLSGTTATGGRSVTVTTPAGVSTNSVTLTVDAAATLTGSGAFGNLSISAAAPAAATFTYHNNGPAALTFGSATVTNVPGDNSFSAAGGTCVNGAPVASGATCTVIVNFKPTTAGIKFGTLMANSPGFQATPPVLGIVLAGTGTSP